MTLSFEGDMAMRIENLSISKPESYISSEYPTGNDAITHAPGYNSRNDSRWMTSIGAVMLFIGLFGIMSALASPPPSQSSLSSKSI